MFSFLQNPAESGSPELNAVVVVICDRSWVHRRNVMQVYWLTDRHTGEVFLVDGDTVERLLRVEIGYVEWCIGVDGVFGNGRRKACG